MLAPEVLAEQVMGYVVWASELIPTLNSASKNTYSVVVLPQGPHFYTGLLQAAGYLLLDSQKKKLIIISQQSDEPENILIDTSVYGTVFGKNRKTPMAKLKTLATQFKAKLANPEQKSLFEQMYFQLPFLRVITETDELLHISIGAKIPEAQMKKIYTWIKNNIQDYNIVLLTNIELSKSMISKQSDETKQLVKFIETPSWSRLLLGIFQYICKLQKKKAEIIAYVKPADFSKNMSLTTRYICAVG